MPTNTIAGPVHHGNCYCGAVRFIVGEACSVHASLYCHCENCRRAHSAPVYHVVYIRPEDFSITHGENLVVHFRKTPVTTVSRTFCSQCGSKVANILHNKPWVGFFPATLDEELQHKLPRKFQPKMHYCGGEAVIDIDRLDPALPVMGADPIKVTHDGSDDASEDGGDDASLSTPRPKKATKAKTPVSTRSTQGNGSHTAMDMARDEQLSFALAKGDTSDASDASDDLFSIRRAQDQFQGEGSHIAGGSGVGGSQARAWAPP